MFFCKCVPELFISCSVPLILNVYKVCSGSEANELAIRLAKTYTDRKNFIVVDHAYHGNTETLVGMSPYKCER